MHSVRRGYCYVIHLRPMCEPSVSSVPSLVSASPARAQSCRNHPQVDTQTYLVLSSTDIYVYLLSSVDTHRYIDISGVMKGGSYLIYTYLLYI